VPARDFTKHRVSKAFCFCAFWAAGTIAVMGISLRQFELMKARVKSPRRARSAIAESITRNPSSGPGVILGIDPSLRGTGYGVIRTGRGQPRLLAAGTIKCPAKWERSRCLALISSTLRRVVDEHAPAVCVVEGLFHAQNLQTALIMGEARGAALAAVAEAGPEIFEIAPRKVKQAIVGYGAAQKIAVAKMVQRMLGLTELPAPDAADALALALAYTQTQGRFSLGAPRRI
jgi:crossover junction endodeoxyribonuclease RuvC